MIIITSEAFVYFREVRYRTAASTLNSNGITINHVGPLRVAQLLRPARSPRSQNGLAAGGAGMCMRRRVAPAARTRPMVPVGPTAGGAASYSAVHLRRGPRAAHGPSWARGRLCPAELAARCRSCGVADGVVNQVGPSGTAHGSSELVKARRPSCRNTACRASSWYTKHMIANLCEKFYNRPNLESKPLLQHARTESGYEFPTDRL